MYPPTDRPVQTKDENGALQYFSTMKEALTYANGTSTVWKISVACATGEHIRLIRSGDDVWQYEPIR